MATFNKLQPFVERLAEKSFNMGSDTFAVALSTIAPASSAAVIADISQISYTNCSSRTITTSSSAQTGGTYKLVFSPLTLTATGGSVATFRYITIYDDTTATDELVGYYDYGGGGVTLASGETLLIDFHATNGFIQIA